MIWRRLFVNRLLPRMVCNREWDDNDFARDCEDSEWIVVRVYLTAQTAGWSKEGKVEFSIVMSGGLLGFDSPSGIGDRPIKKFTTREIQRRWDDRKFTRDGVFECCSQLNNEYTLRATTTVPVPVRNNEEQPFHIGLHTITRYSGYAVWV